jgi:hypothetical protein
MNRDAIQALIDEVSKRPERQNELIYECNAIREALEEVGNDVFGDMVKEAVAGKAGWRDFADAENKAWDNLMKASYIDRGEARTRRIRNAIAYLVMVLYREKEGIDVGLAEKGNRV